VFVGIDVGSRAAKGVALSGEDILCSTVADTGVNPGKTAKMVLDDLLRQIKKSQSDIKYIVGTGYGRVSMPFVDRTLTELSCHGAGAHFLCSDIRTVIDIGGQDSKVITLADDGSMVDFIMNDKCAAGTGRFMEVVAGALGVDLDSLSSLADRAEDPCEITSMCAVFAESEVITLLASGESPSNVAAGLHRAFARRVGAMAKRVGVKGSAAFVGGVAKNKDLAQRICEYLDVRFAELDTDPQLVGALGAAVIAQGSV
jgi:predicted CoA-substrate-specific enzyme activase